METFLDQPEATFYHITAAEKWAIIDRQGIVSANQKIFVSRVGEMPVLAAIALEQLPDIYKTNEIVILKLPQSLNQFKAAKIFADNQTGGEVTKVFQNIIRRFSIPRAHIELMLKLPINEFTLTLLTQWGAQANMNYPNHEIYKRALTMNINTLKEDRPTL